jgi:hypothetical protein
MSSYTFVGCLLNGKSIFYSKEDGLAIEQDHSHLVAATPVEKSEIYKTKSHLRSIIGQPASDGGAPNNVANY